MKVAKSPSLAKSPERPLNTSNRATGARKGASDKEKALEFKNKGNAAFQKGEYQAAIQFFSRGIELDPTNPTNYIFYSNRSAAYFALPDYKRALEDADMVLKLKPDWPKGYSRKGAALVGCKRLEEAISAYKAGLAYDSSNALLLEGLEVAQNALAAAQGQSGRIGTTRSAALTPPHGNGFIVESPASLLPRAKPPSPSHRTAATPSGPLADIAGYQRRESADWHIMAFEDRIWLAHETVSYRPVTIFVFDNGHTVPVFLGIKSHHHPTPAPPELVYEVILTLCARFQVQPASVNVVPLPLYEEVAPAITAVGIPCTAHPPSEALLTAVQQQIARMEKEQEEQWSQTGIHQGTVWQRHLPGLLKVEGVTRSLLEGLMRNAAAYVRHGIRGQFPPERDDNYLLLTIGHSTTVASVVLANSKTSGKITGIARHVTLNDFLEPSPMVNQVSYLFTDPTGIPFDDLTDIKTYQWDIADDHSYPLALVYRPDHTNARPSVEELQWFEIAFSTLTEYVNFCRTYGEADPSVLTAPLKVTASTHAGQVVVIVTPPAALVPPGGEITAAQVPAVQEPDALVGLPPPPAPPAHSVVSQDISASQAVAPVPAVPATPAVAATHSFIPSAAFQGARQGYVFRNGDQGVGYYLDALAASVASAAAPTPPSPPIMAPAPQADGFQPFIPATGFEGKKSGYVFRIGTNGLGYYLDEVQLRELGIVPQTPPAHQAVQQPASQPLNPAALAAQQAREAYERAQREGQQQRQGGLDATIQQPHNEPNRGTQQVMDQIEMLRAQMEALQHQNAELQRQLISTLTSATPQQPSHPVEPAFSQPQQSQPPQNQNPIPPPALPVTQEVLLQQLQQLQPGQPVPAQLLQMVSLLQQQQPQQQQQEQQQEPQQQQQQQQQLQQFQQQQQQQQQLQQHQQAHAIQQPAHQQQASSSYTATQYNSPGTQYQPHSQQFPQPRPAFSQPPVFPPQAPGYIPTGSRPATTPGWSAPTAGNPYTNDLLSKNVRYPVHRGGFAPPGPDMTPAFQPAPYYPSSPAHSPAAFDAPFSPGRRSPVPFDLGAPMPRPPPGRPGYEDRFAPRFGAAPPPNFGRRPPIGGPRARPGQYPSSPEWAPPRQPAIGRYQLPSPSEPLMIEYPRRDGRFR